LAQPLEDKARSLVFSKIAKEVVPQSRAGSFLLSITLLVGTVKVVVATFPSITDIVDGEKTTELIVAVVQGSIIVIVKTIFYESEEGEKTLVPAVCSVFVIVIVFDSLSGYAPAWAF